jgi:hypothetical protein
MTCIDNHFVVKLQLSGKFKFRTGLNFNRFAGMSNTLPPISGTTQLDHRNERSRTRYTRKSRNRLLPVFPNTLLVQGFCQWLSLCQLQTHESQHAGAHAKALLHQQTGGFPNTLLVQGFWLSRQSTPPSHESQHAGAHAKALLHHSYNADTRGIKHSTHGNASKTVLSGSNMFQTRLITSRAH